MKIKMYKKGDALVSFDDEAAEVLRKWKPGVMIEVEAKKPRNSQFHRKLFAMLNIVFRNTDKFKNMDELLYFVKIETGHTDIVELKTIAFRIPRSIAFNKMNEDEFGQFYNKAVDVCLLEVPIDRADLADQVSRF